MGRRNALPEIHSTARSGKAKNVTVEYEDIREFKEFQERA
jgi:hypothetical protein